MKGLRRLLGFLLYLFMAFPLTLGGLSLVSLRPALTDPSLARDLVTDERFERLVASPDLVALAPETLTVGGVLLDGKAATGALQASIPASIVVATATEAVDSAIAALVRGETSFSVNAIPMKRAMEQGAGDFAEAYQRETRLPRVAPRPGQTPPGATVRVPEGVEGLTFLRTAVIDAARAQPDAWMIGEAGSRLELALDGRLPTASVTGLAGLAGASIWLLVTGAGLCFASVMVSDSDWRRRFGRLGKRLLVPSVIVLAIGLAPRLILPASFLRLPSGLDGSSLPDVAAYLRFIATRVGQGFLITGLVGLGVGTVFTSLKRALPLPEDQDEDA